jgi:hypothetical protein
MASRSPGSQESRRWRAVIWPSSPPPLPDLGFAGPYGLWQVEHGGVFMGYDMADHQGFLYDERLLRLADPSSEQAWADNQRRHDTWLARYRSGRGETYLTLTGLDLMSIGDILEWVSTYGVLNIRARDTPAADRDWYGKAAPRPVPLRALRHYPGFGDFTTRGAGDCSMREEVVAICEAERAEAPNWIIEETLHEFVYGAEMVCDLATAWDCLRRSADPREQAWRNPLMPGTDQSKSLASSLTAQFLERTISDALERFSPRMYLLDQDGRPNFRDTSGSSTPNDVTTYETMILELFRHISEDAAAKACEKCGKLFVRQDGDAVHGQSRMTGVKYCSRACAKAAAQRDYRRRQSQARDAARNAGG